jgi:hypothetical protein
MELDLLRLKQMHPLLSTSTALEYAFRAAIGLARHGHRSGVMLNITMDDQDRDAQLLWAPNQIGVAHLVDYHRVTEDAAEAIALALVSVARGWVVRRRLQRGEFADWLLQDEDNSPIAMEISGVDKIDISLRRLREKIEQVKLCGAAPRRSVCIVELEPPRCRLATVR